MAFKSKRVAKLEWKAWQPPGELVRRIHRSAHPGLRRRLRNERRQILPQGSDGLLVIWEEPLIVRISWIFETLCAVYRHGRLDSFLRAECDDHALIFEADGLDSAISHYLDYRIPNAFERVPDTLLAARANPEEIWNWRRTKGGLLRRDRIESPAVELRQLRKCIVGAENEKIVSHCWWGASMRARQQLILQLTERVGFGSSPSRTGIIQAIDRALEKNQKNKRSDRELNALVQYIVCTHELISYRGRFQPEDSDNRKAGPLLDFCRAVGKRFDIDLPNGSTRRITKVAENYTDGRVLITKRMALSRASHSGP